MITCFLRIVQANVKKKQKNKTIQYNKYTTGDDFKNVLYKDISL